MRLLFSYKTKDSFVVQSDIWTIDNFRERSCNFHIHFPIHFKFFQYNTRVSLQRQRNFQISRMTRIAHSWKLSVINVGTLSQAIGYIAPNNFEISLALYRDKTMVIIIIIRAKCGMWNDVWKCITQVSEKRSSNYWKNQFCSLRR